MVHAALNETLLDWVRGTAGAESVRGREPIQSLWSGYGELVRVLLEGGSRRSVIVKRIAPPETPRHPRGWSGGLSHERKLRSYQVERCFYAHWASKCPAEARVPRCLGVGTFADGWAFVLEDLREAGLHRRFDEVPERAVTTALGWLAAFHARFLGASPEGLWPTGTYWHLATRPEELEASADARLKEAAGALDARLEGAAYKTLVHGDAKVANFCFNATGDRMAAVDFQYVGGGCGMKDIAYFFSSCLSDRACEETAPRLLDVYFERLRAALSDWASPELDALEHEWRALYPVAWADFARFLSGWAPGHWKLHGYARRMVRLALATS
jgi:hypothetical protein